MSSFCQNVERGSPSLAGSGVKSTSGSPGSLSRSDEISSSSCGFAGSASEYVFTPNRPVTTMTSSVLPPRPCPPSRYWRKLIAVAHLPSGIVLTNWTFLPCPAAGAATASATPSANSTDPLTLNGASPPKWLPSEGVNLLLSRSQGLRADDEGPRNGGPSSSGSYAAPAIS